jgi:2-phosphosulfolactate phosphatase
MGDAGERETDEDTLCAEYLRDRLSGRGVDFERIREHLRCSESARKFFDPRKDWAPERDFELCMRLNRFGFVLHAALDQGGLLQLNRRSMRSSGENLS